MSDKSLSGHLRQQFDFLERSCKLYDEGYVDEAIRIAIALRVLFHSTKNQQSLIRQMGADNVELLSTCPKYKRPSPQPIQVGKNEFKQERPIFPGIVTIISSVGATAGTGWKYRAPLDSPRVKRWLRFGFWWQEVVCAFPGIKDITRAVIVTHVANKEGAHVDLKLSDEYRAMITSPNLANLVDENGKLVVKPLKDYHLPALRQIGHEVLKSPALVALCDEVDLTTDAK